MADDTTRIINLTEATEIADGMYLVTDASTGTRKLALQKVIDKAGANVADEYSSSSTYAVGDLCVYNGVLYECTTAITTAEAWNSDHWEQVNLGDIIADMDGAIDDLDENKADKNGEYDYMTVGLAKQLKSSVMQLDSQPFNFRTTGGSSDVGDREYMEIVGASANVNQLSQATDTHTTNDVVCTKNDDGGVTLNGTASSGGSLNTHAAISCLEDHIYLVDANNDYFANSHSLYVTIETSTSIASGDRRIFKASTTNNKYLSARANNNEVFNNQKLYLICIDLTAYFGSNTIPDYIYSLEQGTAGAGITWIRNNCPILLNYHAYSQPTMKHVSGVTGYETTGVNQWDEEWELGDINPSTGAVVTGSYLISKNLIPIIGGATYYFKRGANHTWLFFYDADGNYFSVSSAGYMYKPSGVNTFDAPSNARYMRFIVNTTYGTTYNHDICINLHWSGEMDGTYHPYEKHTYEISGDVTLRGIYKLDANNQLVADGDVRTAEGDVTRKYGIVTVDGSEEGWIKSSSYNGNYYLPNGVPGGKTGTTNIITSHGLLPVTNSSELSANDMCVMIDGGAGANLNIKNTSKTTIEDFKAWLAANPITVVYLLDTPTTETAPTFQSPMICNDWGTEEFLGTVEIPVGHNTKYPQNLRDKLQHLPDMAESDGDYIIRQDGTSMALVPLPEELPPLPQSDGTYKLSLTITGGEASMSWESES